MTHVPSRVFITPAVLLLMASCGSVPAHEDVPAVLANPTPELRAELQRLVSNALNGAPVTLADDALTRESFLSVEREAVRDTSGLPIQGRELARPEQFRLVKRGSECVLVHEGSGRRWKLVNATCTRSA